LEFFPDDPVGIALLPAEEGSNFWVQGALFPDRHHPARLTLCQGSQKLLWPHFWFLGAFKNGSLVMQDRICRTVGILRALFLKRFPGDAGPVGFCGLFFKKKYGFRLVWYAYDELLPSFTS
jgi:hypothetical protein